MRKAKPIMIQGTMSGAGKSLLCAALCRIFSQDGYKAAPFKSQNMALNSYVTAGGLEMGRAQAVQAQAAGIEPDVRMNPILLKPSSDMGSQVIVNGKVKGQMSAKEYFKIKKSLIPEIKEAYDSLAREYDIIVIEGAGSPAEINLKKDDIVNMGMAELVDTPVILVGDIDRGGVFAQLYGTIALLEDNETERIKGLIINKFRGDISILKHGLSMLEEKTEKPILGVVPYMNIEIEDEDSMADCLNREEIKKPIDVVVIRLPHISNFTDFTPLEVHSVIGIRYVQRQKDLGEPDMIILPGTKNTMADLMWLRQNGLESAIVKSAEKGIPLLGVCGGYQMLGMTLSDPYGIEEGGETRGMCLLPVYTVYEKEKTLKRITAVVETENFYGAVIDGYEIHNGRTVIDGEPFCRFENGSTDGCVMENVFGTYLHGLFDNGELTELLSKWLCERKGIDCEKNTILDYNEYREEQFNKLAETVRQSIDMKSVYRCMEMI